MGGSDPRGRLPYGPHFHFIDDVLLHAPSGLITTEKVFRATDPILLSHFAGGPTIVPGVILIEMVNQSALLWAILSGAIAEPPQLLLGSIRATFHVPATGDCRVTAQTQVEFLAGGVAFKGELTSGDRLLAKVQGVGIAQPTPASV